MESTATGERTIPVSQSNGATARPQNTSSTVASPTTNFSRTQKSIRRPSPRGDSPMEASSSSYVRGTLVLMMFMVLVVMVVVSMIVAVIVVVIPVIMVMMLADRKSTRLNSSHVAISYAVFCLKKKSR